MSRILVTGGAGFIGVNYVLHHLQNYPQDQVVVYDALTYASCLASLDKVRHHPGYTFIQGDILDGSKLREVMADHAIDTIVHFAAESHVDRSISGPDAFIKTNIEGTYTLLQIAREMWVRDGQCHGHFHHISTDEVFGTLGPQDPPFCEDTPYRPNSPYSASKGASDLLVRAFVHTYRLRASITNCSNNYGPFQFPEKLIPLALTNLLEGLPVPVYGDGQQIRDWLYVVDHVQAIDAALRHARSSCPAHPVLCCHTLGGQVQITNLQLLELLCTQLDNLMAQDAACRERYPACPASQGHSCRELITHVTDRPGHDRRYAIDPQRAARDFGYHPQHTFEQGLALTVAWYVAHQSWWQPLKKRLQDFTRRSA